VTHQPHLRLQLTTDQLVDKLLAEELVVLEAADADVVLAHRAAGLARHYRIPVGTLIGTAGNPNLDTCNPKMAWKFYMCLSPHDPSQPPIGFGRAVASACTGDGWCVGVYTPTIGTISGNAFVAVFNSSASPQITLVPVKDVTIRTKPDGQPELVMIHTAPPKMHAHINT
jgi:hypothetical protein